MEKHTIDPCVLKYLLLWISIFFLCVIFMYTDQHWSMNLSWRIAAQYVMIMDIGDTAINLFHQHPLILRELPLIANVGPGLHLSKSWVE